MNQYNAVAFQVWWGWKPMSQPSWPRSRRCWDMAEPCSGFTPTQGEHLLTKCRYFIKTQCIEYPIILLGIVKPPIQILVFIASWSIVMNNIGDVTNLEALCNDILSLLHWVNGFTSECEVCLYTVVVGYNLVCISAVVPFYATATGRGIPEISL